MITNLEYMDILAHLVLLSMEKLVYIVFKTEEEYSLDKYTKNA
jgi:hypothetical protein